MVRTRIVFYLSWLASKFDKNFSYCFFICDYMRSMEHLEIGVIFLQFHLNFSEMLLHDLSCQKFYILFAFPGLYSLEFNALFVSTSEISSWLHPLMSIHPIKLCLLVWKLAGSILICVAVLCLLFGLGVCISVLGNTFLDTYFCFIWESSSIVLSVYTLLISMSC